MFARVRTYFLFIFRVANFVLTPFGNTVRDSLRTHDANLGYPQRHNDIKPVHGTSKAAIRQQIQQVRPWALGGLETFSNVVWIDSKGVRNTEQKIVPEQTTKLITDAKKYGQALIDTCSWLSTHGFTKKHVFDGGYKKGWRWCVVSWIVSGQTSCPFAVASCKKKCAVCFANAETSKLFN